MLFPANATGIFVIAAGFTFLIFQLSSLKYFWMGQMIFIKSHLKETVTITVIWEISPCPIAVQNKNAKKTNLRINLG